MRARQREEKAAPARGCRGRASWPNQACGCLKQIELEKQLYLYVVLYLTGKARLLRD